VADVQRQIQDKTNELRKLDKPISKGEKDILRLETDSKNASTAARDALRNGDRDAAKRHKDRADDLTRDLKTLRDTVGGLRRQANNLAAEISHLRTQLPHPRS
jgi:phage shock protein A